MLELWATATIRDTCQLET